MLTALLAELVMGWRVAPDRFIKSGRNWIPKWRFKPLARLEDAVQLLNRASDNYTVTARGRSFTVTVRVAGRTGRTFGGPKARTISVALARTLQSEVPE